jgi:hypothetical protein
MNLISVIGQDLNFNSGPFYKWASFSKLLEFRIITIFLSPFDFIINFNVSGKVQRKKKG